MFPGAAASKRSENLERHLRNEFRGDREIKKRNNCSCRCKFGWAETCSRLEHRWHKLWRARWRQQWWRELWNKRCLQSRDKTCWSWWTLIAILDFHRGLAIKSYFVIFFRSVVNIIKLLPFTIWGKLVTFSWPWWTVGPSLTFTRKALSYPWDWKSHQGIRSSLALSRIGEEYFIYYKIGT